MKKTLVTLMALIASAVGITQAETITTGKEYIAAGYDNFTGVNSIMTQGSLTSETSSWSTDAAGNITLSVTGEGNKLKNGYAAMVGMVVDTSKLSQDSFTSVFSYYLNADASAFGFAWSGTSFVGTWNSTTTSWSNEALSTDNATDGATPPQSFTLNYGKKYALVFESSAASSTIYIQEMGTDVAYSVTHTGLKGSVDAKQITIGANAIDSIVSLYIYKDRSSTWATPLIKEIAALPIPEPTTATLSLLALAGLAARRRRK